MKCDRCGRQFPAREAATAWRNELGGIGARGGTKSMGMTVCGQCSKGRAAFRYAIYWFFGLLVMGAIIIGSCTRL